MQENSKRSIGDSGEHHAAEYLCKKGFEIIKRNFCIRGGEIDIIALKDMRLFFIEVKARSNDHFGTPAESITWTKLHNMQRAINRFLETQANFNYNSFQIDILEVHLDTKGDATHITHLENIGYE